MPDDLDYRFSRLSDSVEGVPLPPARDVRRRAVKRRRARWIMAGSAVAVVLAGTGAALSTISTGSPASVQVATNPSPATTPLTALAPTATTVAPTATTVHAAPPPTSPATTVHAAPPPTSPATTTAQTPACSRIAIEAATHAVAATGTVTGYGCAGNFAYAFVDVPRPPGAASGTPGSAETLLFVAQGGTWVSADRTTYCPSHQVPAAIYHDACATN